MAEKEMNPEDLPQSDYAARRAVRLGYRSLQNDAHKHRHDFVQPGNDGLLKILDDAQQLSNKVTAPAEAVMDSTLLKSVAAMSVEQARNLHTSRITFDLQDMAKRCVRAMRGAPRVIDGDDDDDLGGMSQHQLAKMDWSKLDDICSPCNLRQTPVATFMYGPMALKAKERKQAQRRQADKTGEKVTPQQLNSANQYQESTTEEVQRVVKYLRDTLDANPDYEAVPYFEFILNPSSFSQSVENIFHTSFLIKDGIAFIKFDGDEPFIGITDRVGDNVEAARSQFIVELDIPLWKDLVDVFDITDPCIPTRQDPENSVHT